MTIGRDKWQKALPDQNTEANQERALNAQMTIWIETQPVFSPVVGLAKFSIGLIVGMKRDSAAFETAHAMVMLGYSTALPILIINGGGTEVVIRALSKHIYILYSMCS